MQLTGAFQPILDGLKRLWPFWNLQICILVSLSLQVILLILGPFRKWAKKKSLFFIVWASYLLSDWIAVVSIGIIFKGRSSKARAVRQSKIGSEDFMPMWAPFLLLHLGGPDTITSYAIADNQLWLRHLMSLLFQVFSAAYIIYLSLPVNKMPISTVAVFVAGTIKYSERTRALFLASLDRFGHSVLPKPDPGVDYEVAARIHAATSSLDAPASVEEKPTKSAAYVKASEDKGKIINVQSEIKVIQEAYDFFEIFKGLLVGHLLSTKVRRSSRRYLRIRTANQVFRLLAYELSFMYDVLHTKVVVVRTRSGCALRVICFISLMVALFEFRSIEGQYRADYKSQVRLSYTLFFGALGVEALNVLLCVCSDWTVIKLNSRWSKFFPKFILARQRWSMSFSRYDMISYLLHRPPHWLWKLAEYAQFVVLLDKVNTWHSLHTDRAGDQLQEFIFSQLEEKGRDAKDLQTGIKKCSQRGDGPLPSELKWSIEEYQYPESLLLWHVATEICYQTPRGKEETGESTSEEKQKLERKEICKQISDYMFYLLVMQPALMAPVLGNWQRAFQDTRAEALRFFKQKKIRKESKTACEEALKVRTPYRAATVKGNECKSVFFDAIILAQQLLEHHENPWILMSNVWLELMHHAAIRCAPYEHAQQLSTGGELLTFVWLLMNHLGLGTQFYDHAGIGRTKVIRRTRS